MRRLGVGAALEGRHITAAWFGVIEGWGSGAVARPPWPGQGQPFSGETAADGSWCAWRVCGANHRELGRGISVHPDLDSVLDCVGHLRAHIERAVVSYAMSPSGALWCWRMTIDAAPVATSSRAYFRQRECAYAVAAFTAAIRVAAIPTAASRRHWAGQPNGRRTPKDEVTVDC
jgi:hypothetical protein